VTSPAHVCHIESEEMLILVDVLQKMRKTSAVLQFFITIFSMYLLRTQLTSVSSGFISISQERRPFLVDSVICDTEYQKDEKM